MVQKLFFAAHPLLFLMVGKSLGAANEASAKKREAAAVAAAAAAAAAAAVRDATAADAAREAEAAREAAAAKAAAARLAAEVAEPIDESYHVVFSSRRGVLFLWGGLPPAGRGDGVPAG